MKTKHRFITNCLAHLPLGGLAVLYLLSLITTSLPADAGRSPEDDPTTGTVAQVDLSNPYALNLFSSPKPIDPSAVPRLEILERNRIYTTRFEKDGKVWHRLRLGFFPTCKDAQQVLDAIHDRFPQAWVTKVSRKERGLSAGFALPSGGAPRLKPIQTKSLVSRQEPVKGSVSDPYALNLLSSTKPIEPSFLPSLDTRKRYRIYTTRFEKDGKIWYRLRLGFFSSVEEAQNMQAALVGTFPQAWVTRVSKKENDISVRVGNPPAAVTLPQEPVEPESPDPQPASVARPQGALPPISEERLALLMESAKKAMTDGDYRLAVQYYTKILEYPDHEFQQDAQEFLGLARERNGQFAHAQAEYERYLRLYPTGVEAERVRQRLDAIVTAQAQPKKKLRIAKGRKIKPDVQGNFSLFYDGQPNFIYPDGDPFTQFRVPSYLDLNIRRQDGVYDISHVLSPEYRYRFLDDEDPDVNKSRLSRAYLDLLSQNQRLQSRIGRQSRSTDGVLGLFDGAVLSYQTSPHVTVNLLSGLPSESTKLEDFDTETYFYGGSVDLGTFAGHWDVNMYFINQDVVGLTDRRAVGGAVRYFHSNHSFFSFVDYDISYNELNTAQFFGTWMFTNKTRINAALQYRKSPILTTSNAMIGQGVQSLSDLLLGFSEEEVRELAQDRTATNRSFTCGVTHPLNEKFQAVGEFTVSDLSATKASGGVEGIPGTGYEYFYSAQVIGSRLVSDRDISSVGVRYSDTSSYNIYSLDLNTRFLVSRKWRINPKMRLDYRQINRDDADQVRIRPSFTIGYHSEGDAHFEFEGGLDWLPYWLSDIPDTGVDYFLGLGCWYRF